ncbi:MAG: class I SAM-dependent methyltransferase, partial [Lachnospiraceae bacterium]|nr:class I SAM-dependent methyltransferase [Lachnospiraceae bacterium]
MEYGDFAYCYDIFMDETPYERWSEFLADTLKKEGIEDGLVLDLGCGTGRLTNALSDMGYDMIGVDSSQEMLGVAAEGKGSRDILYLCQDMREFELYGTVRAVVSVCDCINYITDTKDLLKVFKLVNNYLDPKGIFIFDINTEYKYKELLSDNTF